MKSNDLTWRAYLSNFEIEKLTFNDKFIVFPEFF